MKIAVISDTHGRTGWTIPPCDVFIHCGDMTVGGTLAETWDFGRWLASQRQIGRTLIVPGNHDKCFQDDLSTARLCFDMRTKVLVDEAVEIAGVRFWGSPWTPPFMQWSFMADEERLATIYEAMPAELDVLITHGAPLGILDPGWREEHAGSIALRQAVLMRKIGTHVFGHLHGAGGGVELTAGTRFFNVAAVGEDYRLVRQPLLLEVERGG